MKKKFMRFLMPLVALAVVLFMSYAFVPVGEVTSEVEEVAETVLEGEGVVETTCSCPKNFRIFDLLNPNLDNEVREELSAIDRNEDNIICKLSNIPATVAAIPPNVNIPDAVGVFPDIFTDNKCN